MIKLLGFFVLLFNFSFFHFEVCKFLAAGSEEKWKEIIGVIQSIWA